MNNAFLETLYQTSTSFRIFVDRNCQTYGWTKERCFNDKVIRSYAEYVLKDQPVNAKERKYETTRTPNGC